MDGDGVGKFVYWSDRAIRAVAEDNGIELQAQLGWKFGLNWKVLTATVAGRERLTRNRLAEARRLEQQLGKAAVGDFDTAPAAAFVKGVGTVSFARFSEFRYAGNDAALLHIQTRSARGRRVDVCLFGSMDNVRGMGPYEGFDQGWTSSAAPAIGELLASRTPPSGTTNRPVPSRPLTSPSTRGPPARMRSMRNDPKPEGSPSDTPATASSSPRSTPTSSSTRSAGTSTANSPEPRGSSWADRCGSVP